MLPRNHPLPPSNIKWVSELIAALPLPPGQVSPPAVVLQTSSTFLARFPAEIRLQIYDYLLDDSLVEVKSAPLGLAFVDNDITCIARACRQCRHEVIPLIWQRTTIHVDDCTLIALRGIHGIFNPDYIQKVSVSDTSVKFRGLPTTTYTDPITRRKLTIVHTVAHCLERFPTLKHLTVQIQQCAKVEATETATMSKPLYASMGRSWRTHRANLVQRAQAGEAPCPDLLRDNDWLRILVKKLCRVVADKEALTVEVKTPLFLQVNYAAQGGPPFPSMKHECGDLVVDLANRHIRWRYKGEEYHVDRFKVDERDDYASGSRYADVFVS